MPSAVHLSSVLYAAASLTVTRLVKIQSAVDQTSSEDMAIIYRRLRGWRKLRFEALKQLFE